MDLIQIDVVGTEPAQAVVDGGQDGSPTEAAALRTREHPTVHLGGDHDLITGRELPQQLPGELFARSERVDIRGIEGRDPGLDRLPEEGTTLVDPHAPRVRAEAGLSVAHAAQDDARDLESA